MKRVFFLMGWILVSACREGAGPSEAPASLAEGASASAVTVGEVVTPAPTFTVTDRDGRPVAGVPVVISVVEGGGTLTRAAARSQAGATPVGQWLVGTRAGRNVLQVEVQGLPPLSIVVNAIAGPAAVLTAVSGHEGRAPAGGPGLDPLVLSVTDRFGNAVAGAQVSLTLDSDGGSLLPSVVTSDAEGRTSPAQWRIGLTRRLLNGRARLVRDTTVGLPLRLEFASDYHIEVRFVTPPAPAVQAAFQAAADRIAAALVGDAPDQALVGFDPSRCGGPAGPVSETIDDVVIWATVSDIDGPGRVLGRAGPCVTRATSRHTVVGSMQFDAADVPTLLNSGRFGAVVMHEMLHVIGVGSLWRARNLLSGEVDVDPRFTGARAAAACLALGFATACGDGTVPVENTGGSGTAGAHWRESVFDAELMTGFAESSAAMPFSALTISALEDFGYRVHGGAADPFRAVAAGSARAAPIATAMWWDEVLAPRFEVLPAGWTRPWR